VDRGRLSFERFCIAFVIYRVHAALLLRYIRGSQSTPTVATVQKRITPKPTEN
jgi:hypothetical protein